MSRGRFVLMGIVVAITTLSFAFADVDAMPGFARKYKMSCKTCHAPFPRLKPYGDEFAGRGFRMEPDQEPARATYDVGDPTLHLMREVPIGFRFEGFASWKEDADAEIDQEFPWTWKIISGGPISKGASYYFYFIVERGEIEGLEDAYIQLNGPFGLPFDLMFGQFQVSDPLFKRETRLERSDYQIYRTTVGESGLNLTYDRGIIAGTTAPGEIDVLFQLVNGNGIPHADEERNFDDDEYKNPCLRLAREIEGIRVGLFGYYGFQEDDAGVQNETIYFGPDLIIPIGEKVEANLQYLERRDDDPFFEQYEGDAYETRGGFAEVHFFPEGQDGRWVVTGLYNKVESDDAAAEFESVSLTVNRLLARNLRLLAEVEHDLEAELNRATVGLSAGF